MSQERILLFSMELSNKKWCLCFSDGRAFRQRTIEARDQGAVLREVSRAKEKFGLPEDCQTISCYEAGRDGFWIHRLLEKNGIRNRVLDPASIEVNRRSRRKKTDRLDAEKLTRLLLRVELFGEKKAYSVVRVPGEAEEAAMRIYREREKLKKEEKSHLCRIQSLLFLNGIKTEIKPATCQFEWLRDWEGKKLPEAWLQELEREQQRLKQVQEQRREIERYQAKRLNEPESKAERQGKHLALLYGVGKQSSWVLSHEFFGWREFRNRKQVGACAGLVGTPYASGDSAREQGISKAGNKRIRHVMIELAWGWLRHQPESDLSQWFERRFGHGTKRLRRVGIVALARKLLVALWKYVEHGEVPEGAVFGGVIK